MKTEEEDVTFTVTYLWILDFSSRNIPPKFFHFSSASSHPHTFCSQKHWIACAVSLETGEDKMDLTGAERSLHTSYIKQDRLQVLHI